MFIQRQRIFTTQKKEPGFYYRSPFLRFSNIALVGVKNNLTKYDQATIFSLFVTTKN